MNTAVIEDGYCGHCDMVTMQPLPVKRGADSVQRTCCAALVDWLKAEMDDDEIAKINARDHGEWDRYHRLEGHRMGLLHVLHHIRAAQHNDPGEPSGVEKEKSL